MRQARAALLSLTLLAGTTGLAMAACPAPLAGSTAEVLEANQRRLICLQREIENDAAFKAQREQFRALEDAFASEQVQRRFDTLPKFEPPRF